MNASATMRRSYYRTVVQPTSFQSRGMPVLTELETRPIRVDKLASFKPVDHLQHREQCQKEREDFGLDTNQMSSKSYLEFDDLDAQVGRVRLKKMFTVFPYRDPVYLVAIIFAIGSLDLVINALFDLTSQANEELRFKEEEEVVIPITVLIGSIFFFVAGILDTFGALNADQGTVEKTMDPETVHAVFKPALIGSSEWKWVPSSQKFLDLLFCNLAFQAGLIVLIGGIIFMIAGVTDFPGLVPEDSANFKSFVFGPQVLHGAMFFIANAMLAISEQKIWWRPDVTDADWQGAFLNATGGFFFMLTGLFLFADNGVAAAAVALIGSLAFLIGSLLRWFIVMEFY